MSSLFRGIKQLVTGKAPDDGKALPRKKPVLRKKKPIPRTTTRPTKSTTTTTRPASSRSSFEDFSSSPSSFDVWWDDPVNRSVLSSSYDPDEQVVEALQDQAPPQQSWWDVFWNGKGDEASDQTSHYHGHRLPHGAGDKAFFEESAQDSSVAVTAQQESSQSADNTVSGDSSAIDAVYASHNHDTGSHSAGTVDHGSTHSSGHSHDSGSSYSSGHDTGSTSYDYGSSHSSDYSSYDSSSSDSGASDSGGMDSGGGGGDD